MARKRIYRHSEVKAAQTQVDSQLVSPYRLFCVICELCNTNLEYIHVMPCAGRTRGGCVRCRQSNSLQVAVKVLYALVAFLIVIVVVLASLGEL